MSLTKTDEAAEIVRRLRWGMRKAMTQERYVTICIAPLFLLSLAYWTTRLAGRED